VMDHYGQFLETPHGWWMEDIKRFQKVLRECGLSVNEFLREEFVMPQKSVQKPKSKVRKSVVTKKKTPVKKKTPTKRKKVA